MKHAEKKHESVIQAGNLNKKYGDFQLSIPRLEIPRGFATALIGENGAGKTTLLNILSGIRLDFQGEVSYFGDRSRKLDGSVQERIGYTGPGSYYLPHWTIRQVEEICGLSERTVPGTLRRNGDQPVYDEEREKAFRRQPDEADAGGSAVQGYGAFDHG